jgi:hypothetical protein
MSLQRRESGAVFATDVRTSSQIAIVRFIKAAGVFRFVLRNKSPRPSPLPLAKFAEAHQKIHLRENGGKLRFSADDRQSIILKEKSGQVPLTMEVHMFKAIAGLVALAALVRVGVWAWPALRREYRIHRM